MEDFRWIYHEDATQVAAVSGELQTGANPRRFSANCNYRKDGSIAHCEWYNSSLIDAAGQLRSILSLVLDVTARTRAEEQVRLQRDLAEALAGATSLGEALTVSLRAAIRARAASATFAITRLEICGFSSQ